MVILRINRWSAGSWCRSPVRESGRGLLELLLNVESVCVSITSSRELLKTYIRQTFPLCVWVRETPCGGGSNWQGKHVEETRGGQKTPLLFAQCHVQSPQMKNTSVNDYYVWNVCRCVCFRLTSDGTKSSEELRKMLLHTDKELQLFIAASSRGQQCKCTSATGQCCYWSFDHSNIIFPPVSKLCSSHSLPAPPVKHLHHPQMFRCLLSALSLPLALFHHSD